MLLTTCGESWSQVPDTLDLTPQRQNLVGYRGDTLPLTVLLVDGDGLPVDLTGATVTADVRAGGVLVGAFAVTVTDPLSGAVMLEMPPAGTRQLPRFADWDCQVVWPDLTIQTVLSGLVTAGGDVTV